MDNDDLNTGFENQSTTSHSASNYENNSSGSGNSNLNSNEQIHNSLLSFNAARTLVEASKECAKSDLLLCGLSQDVNTSSSLDPNMRLYNQESANIDANRRDGTSTRLALVPK